MLKTIKKVILSSLSILALTILGWTILLLNPSLSYANKSHCDFVTIHHNQDLEEETNAVIREALGIIKKSALYEDGLAIDLCLNENSRYASFNPIYGQALAYAQLDIVAIKNCKLNFAKNLVVTKWPQNNFEERKFKLSWILAHEFMHTLQYSYDPSYYIKSTMGTINWKLEGHAEYVSREFKNDGLLKEKIKKYIAEEKIEHIGFPVFELEDGTQQILSYYKYALVIQYLMEEKELDFKQIALLDGKLETWYSEMINWSKL